MPEIPSLPENSPSDDQCWVWYSGNMSLTSLSRLIGLDCIDLAQQTEKQDIAPDLNHVPIVVTGDISPNLGGINWKNYYKLVLRALTYENRDTAGE